MSTRPITADELLRHTEALRRLARALVREEADAEDLAQDALYASLKRPPPDAASAWAWLTGVTRNLARLRWRSHERRERNERQAPVPDDVPTPEALVERAQAHQLLTTLLLDLDEPLRTTLLLRYYEGLSSAEIARRLRIPAGTVRWRLKRALDELRKRLDASSGGRNWVVLLAPLRGWTASSVLAQGALLMKALKIGIVLVVLLLAWLGVEDMIGIRYQSM
jgi:RNA polymerase sigma-70 factor (ECF subfamily)